MIASCCSGLLQRETRRRQASSENPRISKSLHRPKSLHLLWEPIAARLLSKRQEIPDKDPTMKTFVLLPCSLLLVLAGPAIAQDSEQNAAPCQAQPQPQDGSQKPIDNGNNGNDGSSTKLGSCGGVLQPPPSGDQGMTQPPPDQGKTPVIKPGEVPAQPPKQ